MVLFPRAEHLHGSTARTINHAGNERIVSIHAPKEALVHHDPSELAESILY
jgi:hypothetical protein